MDQDVLPEDFLPAWFERIRNKYCNTVYKDNKIFTSIINEEIEAFHSLATGQASIEDTALAITSPISNTPIPDLGEYSDESFPVSYLYYMLVDALVSWPVERRPQLVALLSAMGNVPGSLHRGEAKDADGKVRTWDSYPWLSMVWFDVRDRFPGEIVMRVGDNPTALEAARKSYVQRKEIEAQLFAIRALKLNSAFIELEVARVFEKEPGVGVPDDDFVAHYQNRLEFHVPAFASLMANAGSQVFDIVIAKDGGSLRWEQWTKRLEEIENEEGHDDVTRAAATMARQEMQDTRSRHMSGAPLKS